MIDSEIIDGQLTGVIEPGSRAHQVLKAATNLLMIRKLTKAAGTPLVVGEREFKAFLRDSEIQVTRSELEILIRYEMLHYDWYQESWEERDARKKQGLEPEFSHGCIVWSLGKHTVEVLQMLRDGDEAYVYC